MIPVQLPREPGNFQHSVYQPGLHALNALGQDPDQPPPNEQFWKTSHTTIAGNREALSITGLAPGIACAPDTIRDAYIHASLLRLNATVVGGSRIRNTELITSRQNHQPQPGEHLNGIICAGAGLSSTTRRTTASSLLIPSRFLAWL